MYLERTHIGRKVMLNNVIVYCSLLLSYKKKKFLKIDIHTGLMTSEIKLISLISLLFFTYNTQFDLNLFLVFWGGINSANQ